MTDRARQFKKIMNKSDSNKVVILTAHYKITGDVYDCEECNKDSCVNLVNARVCNINDSYEGICDNETKYDWLHINMDSVVAYSFLQI